jgi:DNA-binding NtrC family response regulator
VAHFLAVHADPPPSLSDAALSRLCAFSWPGNVRQLENEVRRMLVLGGEHLSAADLSPEVLALSPETSPLDQTLRQKLDSLERQLVLEALEHSGGNRTRAAEALGISRFGLQKMTQRLNIDVESKVQKSGRIRPRGLDERS